NPAAATPATGAADRGLWAAVGWPPRSVLNGANFVRNLAGVGPANGQTSCGFFQAGGPPPIVPEGQGHDPGRPCQGGRGRRADRVAPRPGQGRHRLVPGRVGSPPSANHNASKEGCLYRPFTGGYTTSRRGPMSKSQCLTRFLGLINSAKT